MSDPEGQAENAVPHAYEKQYGKHAGWSDEHSFRNCSFTGKRIVNKTLQGLLTSIGVSKTGNNATLVSKLSDKIDMYGLFQGHQEWALLSQLHPSVKLRNHVSSIFGAWSDCRLFDEFLAWGYDLSLLTWRLANDWVDIGLSKHSYNLWGHDWPSVFTDSWAEANKTGREGWEKRLSDAMPSIRQFSVDRICDWVMSKDWGGWGACMAKMPDCVKGLRCICTGVLKAGVVGEEGTTGLVTGVVSCNVCEVDLGPGDNVLFCHRRRRQWGKLQNDTGDHRVRCDVWVCKSCLDEFEPNAVVGMLVTNGRGSYVNSKEESQQQADSEDEDSDQDGSEDGENDESEDEANDQDASDDAENDCAGEDAPNAGNEDPKGTIFEFGVQSVSSGTICGFGGQSVKLGYNLSLEGTICAIQGRVFELGLEAHLS